MSSHSIYTISGWRNNRPICYRTEFHILRIFRAFIGRIAVPTLAVSHIISEIRYRRSDRRIVRLQSTKIEMQRNLLPLSDTSQIYQSDRYATQRFLVSICDSADYFDCDTNFGIHCDCVAAETQIKRMPVDET